MYLEISGRRSGKTTRLMDAARKAIAEGKNIGIRAFNCATPDDLKQYLNRKAEYMFIDEFEYNIDIDQLRGLNKDKLYVCGTPENGKSEILCELLAMSPEFKRYTWKDVLPPSMEIEWKSIRENIGPKEAMASELGLFE